MSWIKENKFVASTIGSAVVVSGVLLYLGYSARTDAKATIQNSNASVEKINRLKASRPFPTTKNKDKVIAKVANYAKGAVAFQNKLVAFKPDEMVQFSESGFGTVVSEHRNKLTNYYNEKGVALHGGGENVAFGLEEYRGGALAKEAATKFLNYQRNALEWMFKALADTGPTSLDNVFRTRLVEEISDVEPKPKTKKGKKGQPKKLSVYRELPIEITFTGNEKTLKEFLAKLSNAKDYFFVTRSVNIKNLINEPPNKRDASFEGEDSVTELDSEASAFASTNRPIIKQVTGTEEIKVHLKLGLLIFKDASEVSFPKKASKAKSRASSKTKEVSEDASSEDKEENKASSAITAEDAATKKVKLEKIDAPIKKNKELPESKKTIK